MNIAQTRPRFRTDLVAQPIDEGGQRFVDVTDPDSGKTFRFYEIEYSIACAMDGRRDLTGLAEWAQTELGLAPSPEELETVISTLEDLGYLDYGAGGNGESEMLDLGGAGADYAEPDEPLPTSGDFELGNAGKSPLDRDQDDAVESVDLALGLSGNESMEADESEESFAAVMGDEAPSAARGRQTPAGQFDEPPTPPPPRPGDASAVLRPVTPVAQIDEDDGPTNLPPPASEFDDEMSVDLTDHMRIGAADVKEAVRQSKAMQAVEAPQSLVDDLAARGGAGAFAGDAPRKEPPPAPARRVPTAQAASPTELPDKPAVVSKPSTPVDSQYELADRDDDLPVQPKKSRLGLVILVVLLIAAAAGAGVYFYLQSQQNAASGQAPSTNAPGAASKTTAQPTETPTTPTPEPEAPSARLAATSGEPVEVTAPRAGILAVIEATGKEVKEGDVVAKLDGTQALEAKIAEYENDQRRYEKRIEETEAKKAEAEKQGNQAAVKKYQDYIDQHVQKIEEKKQRAAEEQKKMDEFLLRAPAAGIVETTLAARANVAQGKPVFQIKRPALLEATFTLNEAGDRTAGQQVEIADKADRSKTMSCAIAKVEDKNVTVSCPSDGALKDGDEVILR